MILLILMLALLVSWGLAFFRASVTGWGLGAILTLFLFAIVIRPADETILLCAGIISLFFILLGIPYVRRQLLSGVFYRRLRRNLPPLDVPLTEMGLESWEGGLFNGHPDWKTWLSRPKPTLNDQDLSFMQQAVQPLCQAQQQIPPATAEVEHHLQTHPFAQLCHNEGAGLSTQGYVATVSAVACCDPHLAQRLEAGPLLQAARHVGEMRALAQHPEAPVSTRAHAYLLEATLKMVASATDHGTQPCVPQAILLHLSNRLLRQAKNDHPNPLPQQVWLEGVPATLAEQDIFRQGMLRLHPYLFREISSLQLKNPEMAPLKFDAALREHLRYSLSNLARSSFFGLTDGRGMLVPGGPNTLRYYQRITRFSAAYALCCDAMIWQSTRTARHHPNLSVRLAALFASLYASAATLKAFEDNNRPAAELPLLEWALQDMLYQQQQTLLAFLQNLPLGMAWWLRRAIFPLGPHLMPPADALSAQLLRANA